MNSNQLIVDFLVEGFIRSDIKAEHSTNAKEISQRVSHYSKFFDNGSEISALFLHRDPRVDDTCMTLIIGKDTVGALPGFATVKHKVVLFHGYMNLTSDILSDLKEVDNQVYWHCFFGDTNNVELFVNNVVSKTSEDFNRISNKLRLANASKGI